MSADGDASARADTTSDAQPHEIYVPVEAFGSGVLLHPGLAIPLDATIADVRHLLSRSIPPPPRTRIIRLFVGHGGTELNDDEVRVERSALATDTDKPLVVVPIICSSPQRLANCDLPLNASLTSLRVFHFVQQGATRMFWSFALDSVVRMQLHS